MINRFTKTTRVQQDVLNMIATENIGPGGRLPTEKELSARLDVSVTTVQRALANLVSLGLIERSRGRGTFVKRSLTSGPKMHAIALVLINRGTFLYEQMLGDAMKAARRRNHDVILVAGVGRPNEAVTSQLGRVSGVLMSGVVTEEWLDLTETMHLPSVVVGDYELTRPFHSVRLDAAGSAEVAVKHLYAKGCRHIGLVNGAKRFRIAAGIHKGYRRSLDELGLPYDEGRVVWCRRGHRQEDLTPLFGPSASPFDGLVVEGGCFLPLHLFFYETGRAPAAVPLSVIAMTSPLEEPLSRIHEVPFECTVGEKAVDVLFQIMAGRNVPETVLVKPAVPKLTDDPGT